MNNISKFVVPNNIERSLLQYAYMRDHEESVSTSALDLAFPSQPLKTFNYIGATLLVFQWFSKKETKLSFINFNASV